MERLEDIPRNWTFENETVAKTFDCHVREQLPWYDMATGAIKHIARHYIPENGFVYDIGASTGNISRALEPILLTRNATIVGIESSSAMVDEYDGYGSVELANAESYSYKPFDFCVIFLTLMFIPVSLRKVFLDTLVSTCKTGGAIVVFDKLQPVSGYMSTVFHRLTLAGKKAAGVSTEEIIEKELSLSGVQRPLDEKALPDYAQNWFRFGDFSGYLIEK